MYNFFIDNKEWIVGIIASIGMFFTGRKTKKTAEVNGELQNVSVDLGNLQTIRDMEKQLVLDAKRQGEELREIIESLQKIIDQKDSIIKEQEKIIEGQKHNLTEQKDLITRQTRQITTCRKRLDSFNSEKS